MDITDDNAFLFEEHLSGVLAIASAKEKKLLNGLTRHSKREDFGKRYRKLLNRQ